MAPEIKPTAGHVGARAEYAKAAAYVTGLDTLPLDRVVNDAKVTDHHAIIPTNAAGHPVDKMSDDDKRIYDIVVRRFLAIFHPDAVFENTRLETTVAEHVFRTRGRVLVVPGWRGVYGEGLPDTSAADDDEGADQSLPKLEQGEDARTVEVASERKETKPPRRYSDASLLAAMETAGKLVDDDDAREAMKESGIGTPATRAAIIERLIDVAYVERDGRSLVATEKGLNVIRLLGEHPITSPGLTGDWEHRLGRIEHGRGDARALHERHRGVRPRHGHRARREAQGGPHPAGQPRPVPGLRAGHRREPQGLLVLVARGPGMRLRDLEEQGGQDAAEAVAKELIATGRTARPVTGFKGRSGKSFRARLALQQGEDGKWRVEFDEPWARDGAKPPEAEDPAARRGDAGDDGRRRGGVAPGGWSATPRRPCAAARRGRRARAGRIVPLSSRLKSASRS